MPLTRDQLVAQRDAVLQQLAELPATGMASFTDQGRTVSFDRAGLLQQLDTINKMLAAFPFVIPSRQRA